MNRRIGTLKEFQEHTLAIARRDREVDPEEPRLWSESKAQTLQREPDFRTEKELEDAVGAGIRSILPDASRTVVLHGFGLDLAIFAQTPGNARTFFFEIKAFAENHGRSGFGDRRGDGNQIRLLFDEPTSAPRNGDQLAVLDSFVRWIIGNRCKEVGSPRFLFLTASSSEMSAGQP